MATDGADEKVTDSGFGSTGVTGVSCTDWLSSLSRYCVISTASDVPYREYGWFIPARTSVEKALWCSVPGAERRWSLASPTRTVIMLNTMEIIGDIFVKRRLVSNTI